MQNNSIDTDGHFSGNITFVKYYGMIFKIVRGLLLEDLILDDMNIISVIYFLVISAFFGRFYAYYRN